MLKRNIAFCPEGAAATGFSAFSALMFAILGWWIPACLFWLFFAFCLHFFRDPERVAPEGKDIAASPADGTIIKIETRPEPFSGQPCQCVSIFMSVFNVHVNRAPLNCVVHDIRYFPGRFFNASFDKASKYNERCAWMLHGDDGSTWTMVQIAGLIAQRIVCRAERNERLAMGQRLGMIRFGSRVDLYLPQGYAPAVDLGDKVFGGQTIIARKKEC